MKPSEILRKAADLIEPEGAWTQEAFARTKRGRPIGYGEAPAMCFCALGAMYRSSLAVPLSLAEATRDYLDRIVGSDVTGWNDAPERTQAEVVQALRDAASLAEAEAQ